MEWCREWKGEDQKLTLEAPNLRSALGDKQSPSLILWHLPVKYDLNQSSAFPVTPNQSSSLLKKIVWSMVLKTTEICQWPCGIHWMSLWVFSRAVSVEWNVLYADWYWLDMFELFICEFSWFTTTFRKSLGKEAKIGPLLVIVHVILIEGRFLQMGGGGKWEDLKCEGKEPSVSNSLIIDHIGVIKMSIQSFTRLVGTGSKSEDLHWPCRTRRHTSSVVTQVRLCKTFLVSGGFHTRECESEEKKERMTEIY